MFLSEYYGAPVMLLALLFGMALSFLYEETRCHEGVDFTASHLLRLGVMLIGLRIGLGDLFELGWSTVLLLILGLITTIGVGIVISRLLSLEGTFGILTGGAVGICGASAALAISCVLPKNKNSERDTLLTIVGVTVLSTVSMILYPIIATVLGLDVRETSIFLGGTIHDVAQVAGAGYALSADTGDLSTLTKLLRVSFLVPIVLGLTIFFKSECDDDKGKATIPYFVILFFGFMLLNTFVDLPSVIVSGSGWASKFFLIMAIAAIGMKSNLKQLLDVGLKPFALLLIETIWIAGFILMAILSMSF